MDDYICECPVCGGSLNVICGHFRASIPLHADGFAFADAKFLDTSEESVKCPDCDAIFSLEELTLPGDRIQDLLPWYLEKVRVASPPHYQAIVCNAGLPCYPAYAREDEDSEWWRSKDAKLLLEALKEMAWANHEQGGATEGLTKEGSPRQRRHARRILATKSQEELDDLVHDMASLDASAINNSGRDDQIEYLIERGWGGR